MYRVKAEILSDDLMIIEDRAEVIILDRIGFAPIVVKNGSINIEVPNENSKLQIDVFGYAPKVIKAKEINAVGTVYLNPSVNINSNSNPKQVKGDNTLLYVLGAAGAIGLFYYATKKPAPKTVKIS